MKRFLALGCFLSMVGCSFAAGNFWQALTADEKIAAGLDQLTPAQQAALDSMVERHALTGTQEVIAAAQTQAAEKARAQAETDMAAEQARSAAAKLGLEDDERKADVVTARIEGTFNGWSGRTLFRLNNGQTWAQTDTAETYWLPAQTAPEVQVRRSELGGWKLFLSSTGRWVRVKRIR